MIFKSNGKGELVANNNKQHFNYSIENNCIKVKVEHKSERSFYLRKNNTNMFEMITGDKENTFRIIDFVKQSEKIL